MEPCYNQSMSEVSGVEAEKFHLTEARKALAHAKKNLFGVDFTGKPMTDLKDSSASRAAVREVVWRGLTLAKAEREASKTKDISVKEAASQTERPKGVIDFESEVVRYQRALDVVDGKRARPDSLVQVINAFANEMEKDSIGRYDMRIANIPSKGFLGLKGKDRSQVNKAGEIRTKEQKQTTDVIEFVNRNAGEWQSEEKDQVELDKAA